MNKRVTWLLILTVLIGVGLAVRAGLRPSAAEEFHACLTTPFSRRIKAITINGQQRDFTIISPKILSEIEAALSTHSTNMTESGITYELKFEFASGKTLTTFCGVYADGKGFSLADAPENLFADPLMIDVRVKQQDEVLRGLLKQLTSPRF